MRYLVAVSIALICMTQPATAQCLGPNQVGFRTYGEPCSFFLQEATLTGSYERSTCTMTLTQSVSNTCCNTYPTTQFLLLGFEPRDPGIAVPWLPPGCTLALRPIVHLAQPANLGGTWAFTLPSLPFPAVLYAQGLNQYFTTVNFSHDFQTTNGLEITFS